jgi:uncharacterized protein YxjI
MQNRQLVYTQQHEKGNRSYVVEVYKGMEYREGHIGFNNKKYEEIVKIKAFSIIVRETITKSNGNQTFHTEHFMGCTARANEFDYALKMMKADCDDLREIRALMAGLRERFSVALDKDAKKAVRKALGLYNRRPVYDITARNTKVARPLPQPDLLR